MTNSEKVARMQARGREYVLKMEAAGWEFEDRVHERINRPVKKYYTNKDVERLREVYSKQRLSLAAKPVMTMGKDPKLPSYTVPEAMSFTYRKDKDGKIVKSEAGVKQIQSASGIKNVTHNVELKPENIGKQIHEAFMNVLKNHPSNESAAMMHSYITRVQKETGIRLIDTKASQNEVVLNLINYMPSAEKLTEALNTEDAFKNNDRLLGAQLIGQLAKSRGLNQKQYAARIKKSNDKSNKKLTEIMNEKGKKSNVQFTMSQTQRITEVLQDAGSAWNAARKKFRGTTWSDDVVYALYERINDPNFDPDKFAEVLQDACNRDESEEEIKKRWDDLLANM